MSTVPGIQLHLITLSNYFQLFCSWLLTNFRSFAYFLLLWIPNGLFPICVCRCDKHFYETAYWRHMSLVHPSAERLTAHPCPHCPRHFPTRGKLRAHSAVHAQRTVPCTQCDKLFANAEKLRSHVRTVHRFKEDISYACSECGVTYRYYLKSFLNLILC